MGGYVMILKKWVKSGIAAMAILCGVQLTSQAQALTCNNIAGSYNMASPISDFLNQVKTYIPLTKGDILSATSSFNVAGTGVKYTLQIRNVLTSEFVNFSSELFNTAGEKTVSGSITVPKTANYDLIVYPEIIGSGSITGFTANVSCGGFGATEIINGSTSQVANLGQQQVNRMLNGRIRQIQGKLRTETTVPGNITTSGLSHQLNQQDGKNAGAPDFASGVWGNIALTHFEDTHRPTDLRGLQGTLMAGIDTRIMDDLIIGAAVNLERSQLELGNNNGEFASTSFGVSPYVSWQIDDIFSLTGMANVSHIHSRYGETSNTDTITEVDVNGVRWGVSATGDGFFTWGNWGLLSSLNLSYNHLTLFSAKNNQGLRVAGSKADTGSASLMLQPSYFWQYDRDLALEPYLLAEYQYDFTMQKVSTPAGAPSQHPNDEDQFRLGAGLNVFGGAFYSANLEATAIVGRERYTEATISSSLRINF